MRLPLEHLCPVVAGLVHHVPAEHHRTLLTGWREQPPTGLVVDDRRSDIVEIHARGLPPVDGGPDPVEGHRWVFELDDAGRIAGMSGPHPPGT